MLVTTAAPVAAQSGSSANSNKTASSDNSSLTLVAKEQGAKRNAVADPGGSGSDSPGAPTGAATPASPIVASASTKPRGNFFSRLAQVYADDFAGKNDNGPTPPRRGWPAPVSSPPYPFMDWPYGGSQTIGAPDTSFYPLMTAINGATSKIKVYGWVEPSFNVSTSNKSKFANAPIAYDLAPNSMQLDQATLYIERLADTVQTDHFDWGFRFTNLYGLDYRYTTAYGIFSHQLLGQQQLLLEGKQGGGAGNWYGYDPVMAYVDLYVPSVGQGMDIRLGRYISLPDIEAQLAPNNYTFSHSLLYTYDCYTQTGINITTKINNHWMIQAGFSGGCEAAPWSRNAKATGNVCVTYQWNVGKDDFNVCANSINSAKYSYNNLAAYYATWYHKFDNSWHISTESWYQYQRNTPNVNPAGAPAAATALLWPNSNGAWCDSPTQLTCYAPEWAILNYAEKQINKSGKDSFTIRNEYFDDMKGQRTGTKTRYIESSLGWVHWIGNSITVRPELRYDHSFDNPAFDPAGFGMLGTKKSQLSFASDLIFHY